ncbi:ethanolamine ammonia-lyase subunit EutC [Terrimonas sp. NA20]|uniref:Ethanolamine ammonia-lyase small subunit n=1 Tax=Terrimonas ginsenosidimutans TaxID=2908004 RepID=A0ABS9KZP1_9BACT|nr:ethanolamine ammonia-lyase subunit EutC [Terrimonas ginsenosidimutans]MCG2617728.1 ethanolamine ammonia-lyase subunit EutC [Terrimonas ginsenosidimutans]
MKEMALSKTTVTEDPWSPLRRFTSARIALGRSGGALPLKEVLALKMAHAHARDAVYGVLNSGPLISSLHTFSKPVLLMKSQARNREQYLLDPGLGRQLDPGSPDLSRKPDQGGISIIIADGLSANAVNTHAIPLLEELVPMITTSGRKINSFTVVEQARVAIGDQIGHWCNAEMTVLLIGERPGLTVADSVGAYLTFNPLPGLTDESRNCVSNIHPAGLSYQNAASKIMFLINAAFQLGLTGISLKDEQDLLSPQ